MKNSLIDLIGQKTKNCGYLKIKHGHSKRNKRSKTYMVWGEMKERCNNPKHKAYKNYGGRGIKVCERWLKFENFLKDVGEIPRGLTLDRIDNNGNYESNNWRFTTRKEQAKNRRTNINIGELCLKDYCKKMNINYSTVLDRIHRGWSLEKALTTPIRYKRKNK